MTNISYFFVDSLAIVCSFCALIVLSIVLTVVYMQYKDRNRTAININHNRNGIQLNSISSNVEFIQDIRLGSDYMSRGIMAFNEVTAHIITDNNNRIN